MIAVDTNIISVFLRDGTVVLPDEDIFVPYVVIAELYAGLMASDIPKKRKTQLDEFFASNHVFLSEQMDKKVIDCYTEIYLYLRKAGTPISPNDLWIAAECMSLSLKLYTNDKDFDFVPHVIKFQL